MNVKILVITGIYPPNHVMSFPKLCLFVVVRGVADYFPYHKPPKIGGTSILNAGIIINFPLVFMTLA